MLPPNYFVELPENLYIDANAELVKHYIHSATFIKLGKFYRDKCPPNAPLRYSSTSGRASQWGIVKNFTKRDKISPYSHFLHVPTAILPANYNAE